MATKKKEELATSLQGVSDNTLTNLAKYQAGYQQGENVQKAYDEYSNLKQNAPQAYVSPYQTQLDTLYEKIANRQPFQYSLNGDMLYQNAKEQYQQLGKQAMVDTIGQATQLTGGYGNSYAQNAGNQAYQQYLLKLNEQIPTYQNLAMQRYQMEGDQLNNQYGLLRDRENEAYGRYRDTVSDYNQNLQLAYNIYGDERDRDYDQYADQLNYWQNQAGAENKDYWTAEDFNRQKALDEYQKEQDALEQANWEQQFARQQALDDYNREQDALAQANWEQQFARQQALDEYNKQQDALAQANWEKEFAWNQQKAQQDLAYKYASLANSRAQKEADDAAKKKKEEEENDIKKQSQELAQKNKDYSLTRYASATGLGINNKGIGVALTFDDAKNANVKKTAELQANTKSAITPQNEKSPELKKMDLGLNTSGGTLETATYLSEQALKKKAQYNNEDQFKSDLFDTLEYYHKNNLIDDNIAKLLFSKFGL